MQSELIEDIINETTSYITSKWVIERIPHVFGNNFHEYITWKDRLSEMINVDGKAIILTGSACVGFSLNPENNLRAFSEESDIDIAVVSDHYFNISWHFLRNIGTKLYSLTAKEKNSIEDHRKRLIYWGTIATDKIIQILPFGADWIKASEEMAKLNPTENREINFRIYKDFEALKAYQKNGVKTIKEQFITK